RSGPGYGTIPAGGGRQPVSSGHDSLNDSDGAVIADRYEVIRPLGRGGIGKVFLVRDRETGDEVALKMLRTKYQRNERALKRFEREVSATRQLDHPCIVKILDVHQAPDLTFYTMEYVDGK